MKMNTFVRNRIIKDNITLLLIGIACIVGGLILSAVAYESGWIIFLFISALLIGIYLIIYSLVNLIYFKDSDIYKNWKFYGGNDAIIEEINKAINSPDKEFRFSVNSENLIISNGWIIKPKDFIFVKPKDINWIYVSNQSQDGTIIKEILKIHTNFGLSFGFNLGKGFEVDARRILAKKMNLEGVFSGEILGFNYSRNISKNIPLESIFPEDILPCYCKNAIIGYKPEYENIWKTSPEKFIEEVKKIKW